MTTNRTMVQRFKTATMGIFFERFSKFSGLLGQFAAAVTSRSLSRTLPLIAFLGSLSFVSVGCLQQESSPTSQGASVQTIESAHGISDHKPRSFAQGVTVIESHLQTMQMEPDDARRIPSAELLDVVRWLPELAADSDLRRADWEKVQQCAKELEALLQPHEKQAVSFDEKRLARIYEIVGQLTPLIAKSGLPKPEQLAGENSAVTDDSETPVSNL